MPLWRGMTARVVYVLVGAAAGTAIAWTSPYRSTDAWAVWAATAIALAAASGAVFGYGLARWPEIVALGAVSARRIAWFVAGVLALLVALLVTAVLATLDQPSWTRGQALLTLASIGAAPVMAGLAAIRELAAARAGESPGETVERLLSLRRSSVELLTALGSLVALATLATGAAVQLRGGIQPQYVLILGGTGSALVGLVYGPTSAALRAQSRALSRSAAPLDTASVAELPSRLDERHRFEQALGADRGVFADLQSSVTILAPLLASAAAVFLPS